MPRDSRNYLGTFGLMHIAEHMMSVDKSCKIDFFLIDEAVLIAKIGFAEKIIVKIEEEIILVGELINTLIKGFGVKFYVCTAFMPAFHIKKNNLIENAEIKPHSYLGELLMEGRIPVTLTF